MAASTNYVWFITGANRGIGLELTKQLLQSPSNTVLAACRNPSQAAALNALAQSEGRVHVLTLDITDRQSVRDSAKEVAAILGERGIDYLINNAGIISPDLDPPSAIRPHLMQQIFETNVIAPAYITQIYLPFVEKSTKKTVVNVSSTLGSLNSVDQFGTRVTSYSISKAALNMLTYKQHKERPDIVFISMCPGWLKTDMGGPEALYDVSTGVAGVLKTIDALTPEDSGKFFNFKGETVPW
ncbi:NAD-P-binding protein [Pilatotrama ljubarskyi]|nr:NAD-P-binding protein [Pilatotrama ljubarskyi]